MIGSAVSESQSAFVKGKQILDGILIANEAVDEARLLNKEMLLFKVDFEKAYDSVDLNYLDSVMANMNFPTIWRKWIYECVGTAKASILVNGCRRMSFLWSVVFVKGILCHISCFCLLPRDLTC